MIPLIRNSCKSCSSFFSSLKVGTFLGRSICWIVNKSNELLEKIKELFFAHSNNTQTHNPELGHDAQTNLTAKIDKTPAPKPAKCEYLLKSPIEEGLPLDDLDTGEARKLMLMSCNWAARDDQEKAFWTQKELAQVCNLNDNEANEFCNRLQILQSDIPTELLDYYFGAIQESFISPNKKPSCFSNEFIKARFEGIYFMLDLGKMRFPGMTIKHEWLLDELALYISIKPDFLNSLLIKNNLNPNPEGYYSSKDIFSSNLFDSLEYIPPSKATQLCSIRHVGYGRGTKPKLTAFSVSLLKSKSGKTIEVISPIKN